MPRRRGLLFLILGTVLVLLGTLILTLPNADSDQHETLIPIRGADISFTLQEEAVNRQVSSDGRTQPIEEILAAHGANYARLRVWVNPAAGTSDLASALILAARADGAGLQLLLDLHYSDTWADGKGQATPAQWQELWPEDLSRTVETYTKSVVAAFAQQGTPVDIVQTGNEIVNGMLWPTGQIYGAGGENWTPFIELLKAAGRGARAGDPVHPPQIMIHTDTGGDSVSSLNFFQHLVDNGVEFDLIGLSYYPFWNGSLADLQRNLDALTSRFSKDIVLAETAYPWKLSTDDGCPSVVSSADALPDADRFPATPNGQAGYFQALNQIIREVPGGHGAGYFIWEPGWLAGVDADAQTCNGHSNLTLFDSQGDALPALDAFRPRLKNRWW